MNDEVSKLGQPADHAHHHDDEVLEGRIVGPYEGPGYNMWDVIDGQVRQMYRDERTAREQWFESFLMPRDSGSYHYFADADGIHYGDTITAPGGWSVPKEQRYEGFSYARGPSFQGGWWDEMRNSWATGVTIETTLDDVSDEAFRLMFGQDKNVLIAAAKMNLPPTVPPVDIERVKWPHEQRT